MSASNRAYALWLCSLNNEPYEQIPLGYQVPRLKVSFDPAEILALLPCRAHHGHAGRVPKRDSRASHAALGGSGLAAARPAVAEMDRYAQFISVY
jgi:hypothetical protein